MTVSWDPPGPGSWALDRSHYPGGTTALSQWLLSRGMERGIAKMGRELGLPFASIQARFVHGFMYVRTVPLVGGNRTATKQPPRVVLKIASRLHPEFRRRTVAAAQTLANPPGPRVVRAWTEEIRPAVEAKNGALAAVDLDLISDEDLGRHCRTLLDHLDEMAELHFWLHGYDLGPIARYLGFTLPLGIPTAKAVEALAGASPSTAAPKRMLVAIREALGERRPQTLNELRSMSSEASALLDDYLAQRGSTLVTRYDFDGLTLREMPETLLSSILTATAPVEVDAATVAAPVRALVPEARREEFDKLLADAREVMDMRDDNGPTVFEGPAGLLRLSLLELGRRRIAMGRAERAEDALELHPDELGPSAVSSGPAASELAARRARRLALSRLDPPLTLGPPEPPPPKGVLPGPLEELTQMVVTALDELGMSGKATVDPLRGVGVGATIYRGRARRSDTPEEAMDRLEPGDVLIVRATSPAFNAVVALAGALVTADGGAMSHAAVLSRELGIPAVVGASGALDIPDGALVEVDPVEGQVRVLPDTD